MPDAWMPASRAHWVAPTAAASGGQAGLGLADTAAVLAIDRTRMVYALVLDSFQKCVW